MWQQSGQDCTSSGNAGDCEKKYYEKSDRQDSGIVDSGFLSSSGNILVSSDFSTEEETLRAHRTTGSTSHTIFPSKSSGSVEAVVAPAPPAQEEMRADSGLDLGLSESLSHLSIKQQQQQQQQQQQGNLNALGGGKVQNEPTVELTPIVSAKNAQTATLNRLNAQEQQQHAVQRANCQQAWELYYDQDDEGDTQLHVAIVQGFLEAAFSVIRMAPHPCLLNILNDDCQAPLHLAVLTRQPRIARRLILAGANPAIRDFRGNTPLHLACASGDIACAKALTDPLSLIERNFLAGSRRVPALPQDLEQRNYDGEMCLHVAAGNNHADVVHHLLRLGANLEAREGLSGRTALHLALERGAHTVVNFLLQECQPCLDAPTYAGITAYQIALCLDTQLARELVRLGANPEPMAESDSDMSEDEAEDDSPYLPAIAALRQGLGVRA